jgi:hypothetical protein
MRWFASAVAVLLFAPCFAQDWVNQGSITSREYKAEHRGPNGGVESTDFFTLNYSVSIKIEEVDEDLTHLTCDNWCVKNVHEKHEDCDFSCDEKCTESNHKHRLQGEYMPDLAAMNAATQAANQLAVQGGGRVTPNDWSSRVSQALADFRRECRKAKTFDMPHALPCAHRYWGLKRKLKAFTVRGTMTKSGFNMRGGVRTPINQTVGTHEQKVAEGWIIQEEPDPNEESVACICKGKQADPKPEPKTLIDLFPWLDGLEPADKEKLEWRACGPNGIQFFDEGGNLKFTAEVDVTCTGNDMNQVTLLLTNNSGETVRVVLPPGVRFVPSDRGYQEMMNMTRSETLLRSGESSVLHVSLGVAPPLVSLVEEMTSRWSCLEMSKKEPAPGVKYRPVANRNSTLANLAAITAKSRFRGPHDQARVWVFTDKVSREDINKRLIPGVGHGTYTMILRDVALKGGVDLENAGFKACVKPNLLSGMNFDDGAIRWLVGHFGQNRPKELADYVRSQAAMLAEFPAKEGKDGAAYIAWLADAMIAEGDQYLRQAGLDLLTAVPAAQRPAVAEAGGIACARWLMNSGDAGQYAAAMDLLESYGTGEAKQIAMTAVESAPSDALKVRAAKVAGIESGPD